MTGGTGGRPPLTAHLWAWKADTQEWVRTASGGPAEMRRASNAARATFKALGLDIAVQVSEWTPPAPSSPCTADQRTTT